MATRHVEGWKKSLHSFPFPDLKWGTRRHMRCAKRKESDGGDQRRSSLSKFYERRNKKSRRVETEPWRSEKEGINEFTGKTESILRKHEEETKEKEERQREEQEKEARPRNLRKRRTVCKAPIPERLKLQFGIFGTKSAKLHLPLSKKEIEEDFMELMEGHRPPRRPKKRPRAVQRQVNVS